MAPGAPAALCVGGAALGRATALDEGAVGGVRVLFCLQCGRGEDIGGQPPQLIRPGAVQPVLIQLERWRSRERQAERENTRQ